MTFLKANTSAVLQMGPFLDEDDGKTPETTLTINTSDVRLSKGGNDFAAKTSATATTHDENGWYKVTLSASDLNFANGRLIVSIDVAGALPVWREFQVVDAQAYDSLYANQGDKLEVDLVKIDGQDTDGNNATLNLKQLNCQNADGDAIVAFSTDVGSHGLHTRGGQNGAGQYNEGNASGGKGMHNQGRISQPGMQNNGVNSHGMYNQGNGSGHGQYNYGGAGGDGQNNLGGATSGNGATFQKGAGGSYDIDADELQNIPSAADNADAVWDEPIAGHTTGTTFGGKNQKVVPSETINDYKADVSGLSTFDHTTDEVDIGAVKGAGVTGVNDFKADVSGLSTFDHTTDEVDIGAVKGAGVTGVNDFKADVSGLSTFDHTTDEVDIGAVKGTGVTDVDDFKADVSGLSTFDPSTDEVDIGKVKGAGVTGVNDFKANVSGLSTFDPATDEVDVGKVNGATVTGVNDFKADVSGLSTFDHTTDEVDIGAVKGAGVTGVNDFKADVSGLSTFDPSTDEVDVGAVSGTPVSSVNDFKADVSGLGTLAGQATINNNVLANNVDIGVVDGKVDTLQTDIDDIQLSLVTITNDIDQILVDTTSLTAGVQLSTQGKADVKDQVDTALTSDTVAQNPPGAPAATPTVHGLLSFLYAGRAFEVEQTQTKTTMKNSSGTPIHEADFFEDDTVTRSGKFGAP